jgi:hypothetical protein
VCFRTEFPLYHKRLEKTTAARAAREWAAGNLTARFIANTGARETLVDRIPPWGDGH